MEKGMTNKYKIPIPEELSSELNEYADKMVEIRKNKERDTMLKIEFADLQGAPTY